MPNSQIVKAYLNIWGSKPILFQNKIGELGVEGFSQLYKGCLP